MPTRLEEAFYSDRLRERLMLRRCLHSSGPARSRLGRPQRARDRGREASRPRPTFVVMRGAGSGLELERTYVYLSLLRQLDLDAALLGDTSGEPAGIWAVVVRTDEGLHTFDARLGLPLPGPSGGVATLVQVRNDESVFKPLSGDSKLPYDVTPEKAKASHIFVAEPLSGHSAHMSSCKPACRRDRDGSPAIWRDCASGCDV